MKKTKKLIIISLGSAFLILAIAVYVMIMYYT